MTCEVAVMNTRGIALAADSAVTLGDGEKVYHSAEKLLQLAPSAPVGVMTYGSADLMGVPWETIIAGYQQRVGDRRHDTLMDYLEGFVAFIEDASMMFPAIVQEERFGNIARRLWSALYSVDWRKELGKQRRRNGHDPLDILRRLISEDHPKWEQYPLLDRIEPDFPETVITDYATALDEAERTIFGTDSLPDDIRVGLRTTLKMFLSRVAFFGPDHSGLVIAGMGEVEPFPSLISCQAGPIVKGKLKLHVMDHARITHDRTAMIIPFAQRETIDMIIDGIHPEFTASFPEILTASLDGHSRRKKLASRGMDEVVERFNGRVQAEIEEKHSGPFMEAVAALPRHDLAAMAEMLVNLTAFHAHASVGQKETVAGPIDVAILSKGDGFVWAKRKRFGAG